MVPWNQRGVIKETNKKQNSNDHAETFSNLQVCVRNVDVRPNVHLFWVLLTLILVVNLLAELEGDPLTLSTNPLTAGLVLTLPPLFAVFVPGKKKKHMHLNIHFQQINFMIFKLPLVKLGSHLRH